MIYKNQKKKVLTGGAPDTTKSRMQLLAVVSGLEALKEPSIINLKCDSERICAAIQQKQIDAWAGRKLHDTDLWKKLQALLAVHHVRVQKNNDEPINAAFAEMLKQERKNLS